MTDFWNAAVCCCTAACIMLHRKEQELRGREEKNGMTGLTALGRVLHEEHFRILMWMCDLQNRVTGEAGTRHPDLGDAEEREELFDLIGALDQIMAHHAFEEEVVFPLLRADGDPDLVILLSDDHISIEPMILRLRRLAMDMLRQGAEGGCWPEFRRIAQVLFADMIRHLEKEELTILQRLDSLLDAKTDHQLALQYGTARPLTVVATDATNLR